MHVPPALAARPARRERERAKLSIAREADRQRRSLRLPPGARLGRQPGFLLLAMLGLAVLGGALVSVSRQAAARRPPGYREETAARELRILAQTLALYRAHVGHYPTTRDGDLAALVADPGLPGWAGPYITRLVPDPWGHPYRYRVATTPPTLFSHGPDRQPGTADDLHAAPEDFQIDPALAAAWTRATPRRPTVWIDGQAPPSAADPPAPPQESP